MKKPGNILIVDDNRGVLTAVQLLLKPHFEKIITLTSPIIRKSKFPWFPERSVQFSGKRTKRSVQKKVCTQHL